MIARKWPYYSKGSVIRVCNHLLGLETHMGRGEVAQLFDACMQVQGPHPFIIVLVGALPMNPTIYRQR